MTRWQIEVDDKQLEIINNALDMYTRMLLGQVHIALEAIPDLTYKDREVIHHFARQYILSEMYPNQSPGIASKEANKNAQIAWDIYQVLRQSYYWEKAGKDPKKDTRDWSTMNQVFYDDPLKTSDHPLCTISKIK